MIRLAAVLYILVATVLSGGAVTAVLALRMLEPWQIGLAFVSGLVLAAPLALLLSRHMYAALNPGHKPA